MWSGDYPVRGLTIFFQFHIIWVQGCGDAGVRPRHHCRWWRFLWPLPKTTRDLKNKTDWEGTNNVWDIRWPTSRELRTSHTKHPVKRTKYINSPGAIVLGHRRWHGKGWGCFDANLSLDPAFGSHWNPWRGQKFHVFAQMRLCQENPARPKRISSQHGFPITGK